MKISNFGFSQVDVVPNIMGLMRMLMRNKLMTRRADSVFRNVATLFILAKWTLGGRVTPEKEVLVEMIMLMIIMIMMVMMMVLA